MLRLLGIVTSATAIGGVTYTAAHNDWNVSSVGLFRFGRTAITVASIAADYKSTTRGLASKSEDDQRNKWSEVHTRSANKLLKLCCTNGGVFIKVGQHIGALDYVVPPEYCDTLKVLHNRAPKSSLDEVKRVIKEEFGQPLEEIFTEFDEEPLGTASLAQVHKAKLRETGETVAVKVQHRNVKKHSLVDMTTMDLLVKFVAKIFPDFSFMWLAEEMKINLPQELDFETEGKNAERVAGLFRKFDWLKIPSVNWKLTRSRVLTMEYLDGCEVTNKEYVVQNKLNPRKISEQLSTLYCEMIFSEGFVHCDPHPGNILVRPSPKGPEIVLLDHGLYTTLHDNFKINYCNLWISIINGDHEEIKKWAKELGAGDLYPILACILAAKPWESLMKGLTKPGLKTNSATEKKQLREYAMLYFPEIAKILARVNRQMLLVLKTNDLLRGIEGSLGTRGEKTSLLNMSKYCVRSVYQEKIDKCQGLLQRLFLRLSRQWILAKINCYQFYLWIYSSFIARPAIS